MDYLNLRKKEKCDRNKNIDFLKLNIDILRRNVDGFLFVLCIEHKFFVFKFLCEDKLINKK